MKDIRFDAPDLILKTRTSLLKKICRAQHGGAFVSAVWTVECLIDGESRLKKDQSFKKLRGSNRYASIGVDSGNHKSTHPRRINTK